MIKDEVRSYKMGAKRTIEAIGLTDEEVFPIFDKIEKMANILEPNTTQSAQVKKIEEYIQTLTTRQVAAALHFLAQKASLESQKMLEEMLTGLISREGREVA